MDWPLAVCSASTVQKTDLEPADLIYPHFVTENSPVYYNPTSEWYFLSRQKTSEVLAFVQADSLLGAHPGMLQADLQVLC